MRPGRRLIGYSLLFAFVLLASSCNTRQTPTVSGASNGPSTSSPSAASSSPTPTTRPASWRLLPAAPIEGDYPQLGVWDGNALLIPSSPNSLRAKHCPKLATYIPAQSAWRVLPPGPRTGDACFDGTQKAVWTGKEMFVWGVSNSAFSPASGRWRRLPKTSRGRGGPGVAVWTGRQVIGWGGTDCCGIASDEGAAYTAATNSWRSLPPSPLSARAAPGAWTGTELIVAGGNDGEGEHRFSDAAAYNPITRTWRSLPSMPVRQGPVRRRVGRQGGSRDRRQRRQAPAGTRRRLQPGDRSLAVAASDGVPADRLRRRVDRSSGPGVGRRDVHRGRPGRQVGGRCRRTARPTIPRRTRGRRFRRRLFAPGSIHSACGRARSCSCGAGCR